MGKVFKTRYFTSESAKWVINYVNVVQARDLAIGPRIGPTGQDKPRIAVTFG
jgi:hypothetical protein